MVTYRSDALPPGHPIRLELAELDRNPRVERVDLGRLAPAEVRALVVGMLPADPPRGSIERIVERSDGNPYIAEELARNVAGGATAIPASLRDMLAGRLAGLPAPVEQLLRVCAIAGPRFDGGLLAAIAGIAPADLGALVRDAVARGLLVVEREEERELVSVRQTLLAEAVVDSLTTPERQQLHAAVATVMAARSDMVAGPPAVVEATIAFHWVRSGRARPARDALLRAGVAAERTWAFAESAAAFEQALAIWDAAEAHTGDAGEPRGHRIGFRVDRDEPRVAVAPPLDRRDVLRRTAEASSLGGRAGRAVDLMRVLLGWDGDRAEPPASGSGGDWLRLGRFAAEAGDAALALTALDRAAGRAGDDARLAGRVAVARASVLAGASRYREAREAAGTAIEHARRAGSISIERSARELLGTALAMEGDVDAGLAELAAARALVESPTHASVIAPRPSQIAEVVHGLEGQARALARANRATEVALAALEGAEVARRYGVEDSLGARIAATAARSALQRGEWAVVERDAAALLERSRDADVVVRALTLQARIATMRGALDDAELRLDAAATASLRANEALGLADLAYAQAELGIWRGRLSDAREAVRGGLRRLDATEERVAILPLAWLGLRAEAERAELARARRNPHEATEAVAAGAALRAEVHALTRQLADRTGAMPWELRAMSALADAEWTRLEGRADVAAWETAAGRAAEVRDPWLQAYAQWREAEARLAGRDGRERARRTVRAALEAVSGLGTTILGEELGALARRARLSLAGEADVPAPSTPATRDTLGLTERELEVLALVAEGYTNRRIGEMLFITEKTAGHHVSNVLGKLGLSSRVEAAALAHRLGLLAPSSGRD
jgi:DNA-binding CsgD family transcriptional regulator/tetratricopeptide (TPR) repeat protein